MNKIETIAHMYLFTAPHNWQRILAQNPRVQARYWPRLTRMRFSGWLVEPLRWREQREYFDVIARIPIHPQPIFIMGLWRSGTTHLHNLLGLDPGLGYASTMQCLAPSFIIKNQAVMRQLFNRVMPKHRLFDNMRVELDMPQEEEIALANLSQHSYYNYWLFPRQMRPLYEKYMRLRGLSPQEYDEWRAAYLWVLRQTSYLQGGKPLVLKSPTNLTRARELLKLFPGARFVEITRNPLRTWLSYLHLEKVLMRLHHLQDYDLALMRQDELHVFTESMRQWQEEKALIPEGQLVSARYEDLVTNPLHELQRIYEALGLSAREAMPRWQQYLAGIAGYKTNHFEAREQDLNTAREHFGFMYDAGGYLPDW